MLIELSLLFCILYYSITKLEFDFMHLKDVSVYLDNEQPSN